MVFEEFPKMARLFRECVITEKIDGTNAQILIEEAAIASDAPFLDTIDGMRIAAGSRTRYVTPGDDNYGFARWVQDHARELVRLGPGRHFGEWWGNGINRGYSLDHKRFSLFNTARWGAERPSCCSAVPVLYEGPFTTDVVRDVLEQLKEEGSKASPGFTKPEGVVVFHKAANQCFKVTLENDGLPKSLIK